MLGNMNRARPRPQIRLTSARHVNPTARNEPNSTEKNPRRSVDSLSGDLAGLAARYAGFSGIGGAAIFFGADFCSLAASAFVIGPGFVGLRAAARILAVSMAATDGLAAAGAFGDALSAVGFAAFGGAAVFAAGADFSARAAAIISATLIWLAGLAAAAAVDTGAAVVGFAAALPTFSDLAAAIMSATDIGLAGLPTAALAAGDAAGSEAAAASCDEASVCSAASPVDEVPAPSELSTLRHAARISAMEGCFFSVICQSVPKNC